MARSIPYRPEINPKYTAFGELSVAENTPRILCHFPYNLNTDVVTTSVTGSGAVTHSSNMVNISSGAATSSSGTLRTNRVLEYNPGTGAIVRFTCIYGTAKSGNTQIAGIGNSTDGFFFGYNGTSFGIMRRKAGSDTWIPQEKWNGNRMLGDERTIQTLDPEKGNVYQIRYQWLGYGVIEFSIENSVSGNIEVVHTIRYPNENTSVSVNNPSFPFIAVSTNTSNNTAIIMKIASIGAYIEGTETNVGDTRNALVNTKTGVTTELNILTIRNKSTYQSITNAVLIQPDFLTIAVDGTKNAVIKIYTDATLGGSPSYSDVRVNNSVVEYDVAGTTVSNGVLLAAFAISKTGSLIQAFREFDFFLTPGQTMTFSAQSTASTDATVSISWAERFR